MPMRSSLRDRVLQRITGRPRVVAGCNRDFIGAIPDRDRRHGVRNGGRKITQRRAADEDGVQLSRSCEAREILEETMRGLEAVVAAAPRKRPGFFNEDASYLGERDTDQGRRRRP